MVEQQHPGTPLQELDSVDPTDLIAVAESQFVDFCTGRETFAERKVAVKFDGSIHLEAEARDDPDLCAGFDTELTADQARELAAALLHAADLEEARGDSGGR